MRRENQSRMSEFLLLGLPIQPEHQGMFFALFLGMYLTTVLGNLLIILLIKLDPHLHTPMYFFLSHLALTDVSFSSVTVPKMLINMQTQDQSIPYAECVTQMYFFILFVGLDDFLLTVMAYDRFVAICHPLHYTVIMNPQLCGILVLISWIISVLYSLLQTIMVLKLSFYNKVKISHYFCELNQMVHLACSDTFLNDMVMYFAGLLLGGGPLAAILYSYSKIVSSI